MKTDPTETQTCPFCKGQGWVTPKTNPFRGYEQNAGRRLVCPKCKGAGHG